MCLWPGRPPPAIYTMSVLFRGRELNTNLFFLKLFGHPRDIPAKSRDIPPKKFGFPGFEGHTELFGPHPFTWKTPTPPEDIRTKSLGLGSFFFPDCWPHTRVVEAQPTKSSPKRLRKELQLRRADMQTPTRWRLQHALRHASGSCIAQYTIV